MNWSDEQRAIFEWFKNGKGSLVVQARAGTGKTTTIKEAFLHAPESRMLYAVFNKKNQREAESKITDARVQVRTLHSLGFAFIKSVWPLSKPDGDLERERVMEIEKDIPDEVATQVCRLISFAKNTLIEISIERLHTLAQDRDVCANGFEDEAQGGWNQIKLAGMAHKVMEKAKIKDSEDRISFDDMVWLPVAMGWVKPWYDLVTIDECQDMNVPQLEMARGACKTGGRICIVGDDRQAIYGFRGAASDGMGMMRETLKAQVLGLTTTYRCPKVVVQMANSVVTDYHAAPEAPEGTVTKANQEMALQSLQVNDAVLSRLNAPLMPLCLRLLRKGTSARIEGRDIGKALVSIVKKLRARSVPDFLAKLRAWEEKQIARIKSYGKDAESKTEGIRDQSETLAAVADGCQSVSEIESRILNLFQDSDSQSKPAVVLSTVHKAKGLEWDRVWLLRETFNRKMAKGKIQSPQEAQEEKNIWYVALTRTKKELFLIEA